MICIRCGMERIGQDCRCNGWGYRLHPTTNTDLDRHLIRIFVAALLALAAMFIYLATPCHAQARWDGPRQTAQEAADVLRACECPLTNAARRPGPWPEGPTVFVAGSRPGAASWLEWPALSPRIRLDGTPIWLPPTVYGSQNRYRMHHFGPLALGEGLTNPAVIGPQLDHLDQARRLR
jgi:hypothetical protein